MKKVSLLLVLVFAAITMSAQESGHSAGPGRSATFAKNGFWDNWFVGAGAGASIYFGDQDQKASFFNRPTLTGNLQVGKWISPWLGARVKGYGGSLHSFVGNNAESMMHQKHIMAEADLLINVSNYLGKYNENRFYSFIPYVGLGGGVSFDAEMNGIKRDKKKKSLTVNAGLINKFRLSNRLSLDIELSGAILKDEFDQQAGGDWSYDGLANASASLVYKVGSKTDFSEAVLADQRTIDDLNGQINKLRQDNAILSKRPEKCDKCPEPQIVTRPAETAAFVSNVVFFRINSAVVDKHQEVNIYNTAQYMKENPSAKVKVVGYADKKTGTASINDKLSERRAKAVANELIKKHNIDSNRVKVEWKGDTVQPYAENAWNRVAIFYAD